MANAVKIGRNDECTCGSGKKYKKCCELKQERSGGTVAMLVLIGALALAGLPPRCGAGGGQHQT